MKSVWFLDALSLCPNTGPCLAAPGVCKYITRAMLAFPPGMHTCFRAGILGSVYSQWGSHVVNSHLSPTRMTSFQHCPFVLLPGSSVDTEKFSSGYNRFCPTGERWVLATGLHSVGSVRAQSYCGLEGIWGADVRNFWKLANVVCRGNKDCFQGHKRRGGWLPWLRAISPT